MGVVVSHKTVWILKILSDRDSKTFIPWNEASQTAKIRQVNNLTGISFAQAI